jgi:hypothetical protein
MITFLLQPVAFAIEDLVGFVLMKYSTSVKTGKKRDRETPTRRRRLLGYIWVTAFTFWSWRFWGFVLLRRVILLDA